METKDIVTSFNMSKRLKEAGVKQESIFSWFGDESPRLMDNGKDGAEYGPWLYVSATEPANSLQEEQRADVGCTHPICSAFTISELLEKLDNGLTLQFTPQLTADSLAMYFL